MKQMFHSYPTSILIGTQKCILKFLSIIKKESIYLNEKKENFKIFVHFREMKISKINFTSPKIMRYLFLALLFVLFLTIFFRVKEGFALVPGDSNIISTDPSIKTISTSIASGVTDKSLVQTGDTITSHSKTKPTCHKKGEKCGGASDLANASCCDGYTCDNNICSIATPLVAQASR